MAPALFVVIALPCIVAASWIAVWHMYRHLLNYSEPIYQRYIVRIIFMVPVFSTMAFLSLIMSSKSIYFDSVREVYEAWVIYNFLSLCLAWLGGPGAAVTSLCGKTIQPSWFLSTCCLPPLPVDGRFIRRCKQGALQFVILKPILVAITFVLYAKGLYKDGNFDTNQGYLYVTIIYTVSYSLALYALAFFYVACSDLLQPFKPVPKFILIKSVVFLTYWQGVLFFLMPKSKIIKSEEDAADFQNFVLCIEMVIAAIGHLYAFPIKEYIQINREACGDLTGSLIHALSFTDVLHDTVHQFAPTYHEYVLYSNDAGSDNENIPKPPAVAEQELVVVPSDTHNSIDNEANRHSLKQSVTTPTSVIL